MVVWVDIRSEVPPHRSRFRNDQRQTITLGGPSPPLPSPPSFINSLKLRRSTPASSSYSTSGLREEQNIDEGENNVVDKVEAEIEEGEGPYDVPLRVINALRFPARARPRPRPLA